MSAPKSKTLTAEQTRALFDILTHWETYSEIQGFKYPEAVTSYGFPFSSVTVIPPPGRSMTTTPAATAPNTPRVRTPVPPEEEKKSATEDGAGESESQDEERGPSSSPVLQTLFTRYVLRLPWLRDLPNDFWSVRVQGILSRLAEAELSESYDMGAIGLRKTLATGSSALVEMAGRGVLGGLKRKEPASDDEEYDMTKAEELERAWDDIIHGMVYGDHVKRMCDRAVETDDLEGFSPAAKAAVEYAIIHFATFLHQIFVISPEGQYLLQLLQNVHGLIPYKMVKQTLRIGNVSMMINGMVRLLLAKLSIGGITNWFGLTTNADDGMNLLQRIMSMVMAWDAAEFRKTTDKIEKDKTKDRPDDKVLQAIQQFVSERDREQHEAVREMSAETSQSIIMAVLKDSDEDLASSLTDTQHKQCLEYYAAMLSIHDRDALTAVLCKLQPDLFTQVIRELVNAYEPFINKLHTGVDLREYLELLQGFIDEFIKASKPKKTSEGETRLASVEDYVDLLRKNRGILFAWVHAVASKCPEVWSELESWAEEVFAKFQQKEAKQESSESKEKPQSDMEARLRDLFDTLPESTQSEVVKALDAHAGYLSDLGGISRAQFQYILNATADPEAARDSQAGPGLYLHRWHDLVDETEITPEEPKGAVRKGKDVKHTLAQGKSGIVGNKDGKAVAPSRQDISLTAPDVDIVVKEMGPGFVKILQSVGGPDE